MKHHEYPKWIYSSTGESKLVETAEQHEQEGAGWEETPAAFDKKSNETGEQSTPNKAKAGKGTKLKETDLLAMTVKELHAYLIEMGMTDEDLKGLKKDELVTLAGSL